ncbi:uncharacterized protein LOC126630253 [Malus sylvestris]|uniref:uncharacterized protein LOC126630253 n=1 Tax=Malus sylvestris TaxID=3752 RepID=UPI0021AC1573|nr:uncharacterized protein LOC126630253 [Malus sylvestris]
MEVDALEDDLTETQLKTLKWNRMEDARALRIIQGAVSDTIFPRITNEEFAKGAWEVLQQEYRGDTKVRKKPKTLKLFSVQDLMASLRAFDQRLERHADSATEKAFQSLSVGSSSQASASRQKPQWKGKNKKWERNGYQNPRPNQGSNSNESPRTKKQCKRCDKFHLGECWFKDKPRCHKCNKFGHIMRDYRSKNVQQVNCANQIEEKANVFCVFNAKVEKKQ